jgi:hypothetical protein
VGGGAHCEAEAIGEAVAGIGSRGFRGVIVSGGGARAVSQAADCETSEEWLEKEGEEEGGKGVSVKGATVDVDGGDGAVWGDIVGGGCTVELFGCVYKGGRDT